MSHPCNDCYRKCGTGSFQCSKCNAWLHPACAGITKSSRLKNPKWLCVQCRSTMVVNDEIITNDNQPEVIQPPEVKKSHLISIEENSTNSNDNQLELIFPIRYC